MNVTEFPDDEFPDDENIKIKEIDEEEINIISELRKQLFLSDNHSLTPFFIIKQLLSNKKDIELQKLKLDEFKKFKKD